MTFSLEGKLTALLLGAFAAGALLAAVLTGWLGSLPLSLLAVVLVGLLPLLLVARRAVAPVRRLLRALSSAVASYRDGDFSLSLVVDRHDELGGLIEAHNELGAALRDQRQQLVQRELLLETVTQNSPVALLLVDSHQRVVYSNLAARHLLHEGRSLQGADFDAVLSRCPPELREAVSARDDRLFPVQIAGNEEIFHLSQRNFNLRGRGHRLLLLKHLTRELSRQEVAIWKKLIRVLSHELNNSLAPISSLANSGAELARRGDAAALPGVFTTIAERAAHLHHFIAGYAEFARLPAPRLEAVSWAEVIDDLRRQLEFRVVGALPSQHPGVDRAQIEQLLINLLRNAREAGGDPAGVELAIVAAGNEQQLEVRDRGPGMSEAVLTQALLPFYSTKREGTGLGLALVREITEAHGGRVRLTNRGDGGLSVTVSLPLPP
jgi:nitrogen fixation/metabolism regulation signal transduction histidine kinase